MPRIKWTPEMKDFLRQNTQKTVSELAELVNEKFRASFTHKQIKGAMGYYGLRWQSKIIKWTPEMKGYIKENCQKVSTLKKLAAMVNARFGTACNRDQLKAIMMYHGIRTGKSAGDAKPLFSERSSHGIIYIKISMTGPENRRWKQKHRWVWEQAHGEIPKGMQIIFLDGNRRNCALENLEIISLEEKLRLMEHGFASGSRETTLAMLAVVRHRMAVYGLLRKKIGERKYISWIKTESRKRTRERKKQGGE